ncbi:hypothetical protein DERP_008230 [Dermatophagoides pteronyssinus]|uniref:Uncharacterized protein n=1 Tax=Dermatophagoides pteronyssinus TaxID=6956 RepID=A0ABQ8J627_DERPT|nr:hypothetical protein DERP_008230 [Dermatophagoides pteronyssinus]
MEAKDDEEELGSNCCFFRESPQGFSRKQKEMRKRKIIAALVFSIQFQSSSLRSVIDYNFNVLYKHY